MQTNKQQTTSFPYLSQDFSNYKTTEFKINAKRGIKDKKIYFEVFYEINNSELISYIRQRKISVAVELFCQPVGLHLTKTIPADANNIIFSVDIMDVEKAVEFTAHLIVEESFMYSNSDLTKEWANEECWVEKYNDIGISNKFIFPLEHKKTGKKSSIFKFQELSSLDDKDPGYYLLNNDTIIFVVPSKVYKLYLKVQQRRYESILTSFIIPALTDILRQMINPEDSLNDFNSEFEDKKWYKVIVDKYKATIKDDPFSGIIEPFKAAQLLVKTPIHDLLAFVKSRINVSDEGE